MSSNIHAVAEVCRVNTADEIARVERELESRRGRRRSERWLKRNYRPNPENQTVEHAIRDRRRLSRPVVQHNQSVGDAKIKRKIRMCQAPLNLHDRPAIAVGISQSEASTVPASGAAFNPNSKRYERDAGRLVL
jgi:hypothetical protein